MSGSSTDVRTWAREQGHDVPARGAVPQHLRDAYDAAHPAPVIPGEVTESDYPDLGPNLGVTEADFPPDDDFEQAPPGEGKPPQKGRERKPRTVRPAKPAGIRERIFGRASGSGKPKARHPRMSLADFAEETWTDLAWITEPVPPLSKILTIQAPYAGVVFDDAVKGTPVDSLLQPAARYAAGFRAVNGLAGPPVYVALICALGQRVQPKDPVTGQGAVREDGSPLLVYDTRTEMLFQGLKYSLLQMTKISEVRAEEIRERTFAYSERMRAVDAMIEAIFDMPATVSPPAAGAARAAGGEPNGFRYPGEPVMDGTGADPGRS